MVYLGVDWEARKLRCAIARDSGPVKNVKGCGHTLAEVRDLLDRVRQCASEPVHAMIECGAMYWIRLLHAAGAIVHVVDGKQALRFAESLCSSGAKDDARDARVLAEMGRSPAHQTAPWVQPSAEQEAFNMLSRALNRHAEALTKLQQQLRSLLREIMPNIEQALPRLNATWVLEFLTQVPTPHHRSSMTTDELNELFRSCRVHRKCRQKLSDAMPLDLPISQAVGEIQAIEVRGLVRRVQQLLRSQSELELHLESLLAESSEAATVCGVPGIGPKLCAMILAVEGGKQRDDLSIRMGSSPVFKGSGTNAHGRPKGSARMRRAAHSHDRRGVYLLGRLIAQNTRWGAAMYSDARARNQPAATAYRRIARSMLRIVTSLRKTGLPYDESLYISRLKANGVPWAATLE